MKKISIILVLVLTLPLCGIEVKAYTRTEADLRIKAAREGFYQAYEILVEYENAGVNVTGFVADLNEALENIERAEHEYRRGNYGDSYLLASKAEAICGEVVLRGGEMMSRHEEAIFNRNVLAVSIGSLILILLCLGVVKGRRWWGERGLKGKMIKPKRR